MYVGQDLVHYLHYGQSLLFVMQSSAAITFKSEPILPFALS